VSPRFGKKKQKPSSDETPEEQVTTETAATHES